VTARCLNCRRPRVPAKGLKKLYRDAYELDDFCSAKCAKLYHDVTDAGDRVGAGGNVGYRKPVSA
jgi:hypothetical protein